MKLISIGTDRKLFEQNSAVRQRAIEYGKFFEETHIVVFSKRKLQTTNPKIQISENVFVYPTNSKSRFLYIFDTLKIAKKIFGIWNLEFGISRNGVVISCQDPFETGFVGALLKLFYGFPLHIQVHTDPMGKYFGKYFMNQIRLIFTEFILKYSDRVRVVSKRVGESIKDFSKNVDVLSIKPELRVPPERIIRAGTSYELRGKKQTEKIDILTVCRLEKEKNLETAIKAFKIVSQKFPNAIFTIVGDGGEKGNLELLAKSLGLEDKVKFVGWKDDLEEFYKNADFYLSTSLYEGYGVSVIEAGSFGLPLILSDTGVANDVYKNEDSALVCDALDFECFAKNIIRLLEDKNLGIKMGMRAKEETDKHLGPNENYFEKYANSIKQTAVGFKNKNFLVRLIEFKITFWGASIYARYFVCGLTAAATNILVLYVLTEWFDIWYLYSSILAFLLALILSFILQKFVVFKDKETQKISKQFYKFFAVAVLGVISNTILVYLSTDIFGIWYILSQIIAGFFIMIQNFILYKFFIFKQR